MQLQGLMCLLNFNHVIPYLCNTYKQYNRSRPKFRNDQGGFESQQMVPWAAALQLAKVVHVLAGLGDQLAVCVEWHAFFIHHSFFEGLISSSNQWADIG
jgi:hypothetical protein